jgi:hypothetical protein
VVRDAKDDVANDVRVVSVRVAMDKDGSLRFVDCGYLNFVNTLGATRPAAS